MQDQVVAEMARQEAEIAACTSRWAKLRIALSYFRKRGKLIAALMAERAARVEFDRRVGDSRDPRMGGWQALDRARKEAQAAIAEFAVPEGK